MTQEQKRKSLLKLSDRDLVNRILAFPDRQALNRDEEGNRRRYPSAEMAVRAKKQMEKNPDYRISDKMRWCMADSFSQFSFDRLKVAGITFAKADAGALDLTPVAQEGTKTTYSLRYSLKPEPENPYDKNAVAVYAKTKETAKALSRLISEGKTEKYYFAVVCGKPVEKEGTFVDYLRKDPKKNESAVVDKTVPGAREARLSYQVLESRRIDGEDLSLVGIRLETGRHHQIRVQFSSHGLPLWGDNRYHPDFQNGKRRGSIALCAAGLAFVHPITGKRMEFSINPRGAAFSWFEKPQVYFAGGDAY